MKSGSSKGGWGKNQKQAKAPIGAPRPVLRPIKVNKRDFRIFWPRFIFSVCVIAVEFDLAILEPDPTFGPGGEISLELPSVQWS